MSNGWLSLVFVLISVIFWVTGCGKADVPAPLIKGFEWHLQDGGTGASLRGVCVVSDKAAWFSGTEGTVGRTIDGGATWTLLHIPAADAIDFRDIEAFDQNTALVMGVASPAKFYKTVDGGKTWRLVYDNHRDDVFFNAMDFWDRTNGIAVSDPVDGRFLLIRTADGGDTWQEIPFEHRPAAIPGEAQFAASGTCLRVQGTHDVRFVTGGAAARLFYSTDRGDHWRVMETPIIKGLSSSGIYSVAFSGPDRGIVTGGDYKTTDQRTGGAAITHDSGKSWIPVPEKWIGGLRECALLFPPPYENTILVIGPTGAEFSVDDGATWTATNITDIHSVDLVPSGTGGWGVGADGKVVRFTVNF